MIIIFCIRLTRFFNKNICKNKSLFVLGKVISSLTDNKLFFLLIFVEYLLSYLIDFNDFYLFYSKKG